MLRQLPCCSPMETAGDGRNCWWFNGLTGCRESGGVFGFRTCSRSAWLSIPCPTPALGLEPDNFEAMTASLSLVDARPTGHAHALSNLRAFSTGFPQRSCHPRWACQAAAGRLSCCPNRSDGMVFSMDVIALPIGFPSWANSISGTPQVVSREHEPAVSEPNRSTTAGQGSGRAVEKLGPVLSSPSADRGAPRAGSRPPPGRPAGRCRSRCTC